MRVLVLMNLHSFSKLQLFSKDKNKPMWEWAMKCWGRACSLGNTPRGPTCRHLSPGLPKDWRHSQGSWQWRGCANQGSAHTPLAPQGYIWPCLQACWLRLLFLWACGLAVLLSPIFASTPPQNMPLKLSQFFPRIFFETPLFLFSPFEYKPLEGMGGVLLVFMKFFPPG